MHSPKMVRALTLFAIAALLAGCTTMSEDPRSRTPGKVMDDQGLEWEIGRDIRGADPGFASSNITVVSYNGIVLLAGQVATDALKELAGQRANTFETVRAVHNELQVMAPLSMIARTNDTYLTGKIKSQMFLDNELVAGKIKVVTVNGVVFMMGLLPREEADRAVEVARSVYGVQKIVKVFEYI
jgi:osmotically-inducible protein OsmY